MEKSTRCQVCRKKNTMEEKQMDNQFAMMCSNCLWLDPSSIKSTKETDCKAAIE